jgi:hypothetical protein
MASIPKSKNTDWWTGLKKQDPTICCLQETHVIDKDKHKLCERMGKDSHRKCSPKASRSSYIPADRAVFKLKLVRRDKEGHFILLHIIKRTIH